MKRTLLTLLCTFSLAAEPDLSTPQATARSLYQAMQAQSETDILKIFYVPRESDKELAGAYSGLIVAGKKLADAARDKFGAGGEAIGAGAAGIEELNQLDKADVKITGDTAVLTVPGLPRAVTFHRTGAAWQVVLADFAGVTDIGAAQQISLLKKVGEVLSDTAAEISADRYPTAQAAESVIQGKLSRVMIRAATQASTRPSK